jgi:hypothetical protein
MKKILMAAAAVTALTAGSADAASIYKALVSNVTAYDSTAGTPASPYKIATETKYGSSGLATNTTSGNNATSLKVDQGRLTNAGSNKAAFQPSN